MKIYINSNCYKININELPYINEGVEGIVYNFNGKALKLYKKDRKSYLIKPTIEKIEYLSKIRTKHFNFPEFPILDKNGNLIGHISKLIKNEKPINELIDKKIPELIKYLDSIRNDLEIINSNNVLLSECDFFRNYIYNGKINFIDFDLYRIFDNGSFNNEIKNSNLVTLNDFYVMNLILKKLEKKKSLDHRKKLVSKEFIIKHNLDNITFEEFLNEIYCKENILTIHDYVNVHRKELIPKKVKTRF